MPHPAPITVRRGTSPSSSRSFDSTKTLEQQLEEVRDAASWGAPLCLGCDATLEGVLTATGLAYMAHLPLQKMRLVRSDRAQPRLGECYVATTTDDGLAKRVFDGFQNHMQEDCPKQHHQRCSFGCGHQCAQRAILMGASDEPDMPQTLFSYLVLGFSYGRRIHTMNSTPALARAEELATAVANECERARQFVRFSLVESGFYVAIYRPTANVVPLVASHFVRRMGTERFAILDPIHGVLVLGHKGATGLYRLSRQEAEQLSTLHAKAPSEPYIQALWKSFYDALALPHRGITERGYDLRRQFMPKRLWEGLPELDPNVSTAWSHIPEPYRDRHLTPPPPTSS